MALLKPVETIQSLLSDIPIKEGQIIFCTDTNDIYMDNSQGERTHMTDIIKLKTEDDRDSLFVPLIGKIYLVEETNILYKYNGSDWETISIDISINISDIPHSSLVPGTLQKKGQGYAPRTLGSVVYLDDGTTVANAISELKKNKATVLKSLRNTVKISTNVDKVSIGIEDFNKDTDILFVYVNSTYIEETQDYIIEDNSTIKKVSEMWKGEEETQIFNFVVLKLTPSAVPTVFENKLTLEEEGKVVNISSNNTTELLNKISLLETHVEKLIEYNKNLIDRVTYLEESVNMIMIQDPIIRLQNVESCITSLQGRVSNLEMK